MRGVQESAAIAYARAFVRTSPGRTSLIVFGSLVLSGALLLADVPQPWQWLPIAASGLLVGIPLLRDVIREALHRKMGADLLALLAIVTGAVMSEWLVVGIIALMVSGGAALESAASMGASEILSALAAHAPSIAHRVADDGSFQDVPVDEVRVDDVVMIYPHEI